MKLKKVLIVGGGPAGLMSAIILNSKGCDVTVIDKKIWPIDKVCGEGIMPNGVEILKKHNLLNKFNPELSRKFKGIAYLDQKFFNANFMIGEGFVIRRTELSRVLYEECLSRKIKMISDCELVEYSESKSLQVYVRDNKSKDNYILGDFDYLVGCDGLRSKVRKLGDFKTTKLRKQNRIGARVHYPIKAWSDKVEVYWNDYIECYVAPISGDIVEFIFCWNKDRLNIHKGTSEQTLKDLFSYFPQLEKRVNKIEAITKFELMGSFALKSNDVIKKKVILIGDSLAFLDPITGEGLSLAFEESDLLGKYFFDLDNDKSKQKFIKEINKKVNRYVSVTKLALFFSDHPFLRKFVFTFLSKFQFVFQYLLELNTGIGHLSVINRFLVAKIKI